MTHNGSKVFAIVAAAMIAGAGTFGAGLARDHGGPNGGSNGGPGGGGHETHERHDGGPGRDGPGRGDFGRGDFGRGDSGRDGAGRDNHWDRHDGGPGHDGWQDRHDRGAYDHNGWDRGPRARDDWHDRGWHDRGHGWHDRYWRAGFFGFAPFPRIYVTLRAFGFYGWSDAPFWYDDRYVVRCYDSYGRPVYVEVNPYTGDYIGVLGY